jgi:hypothetical protein
MTVTRVGRVVKLYVVNDGVDDIDMMLLTCLLHPFDYKLTRAVCCDREVNVVMAYHEESIDLLEFEVVKSYHMRWLWNVINDLNDVSRNERINMKGMLFIAETEDGEYVVFDIETVWRIMWQELEDEEEGI